MKKIKVYTSKGIYTVDDVTCPLNAIGVIKRDLGSNIEVYNTKEIDDYEYDNEADDCVGIL